MIESSVAWSRVVTGAYGKVKIAEWLRVVGDVKREG